MVAELPTTLPPFSVKTKYATASEALAEYKKYNEISPVTPSQMRQASFKKMADYQDVKSVEGELNIIQMRTWYEGMARQLLMEDVRATGSTKMYTVAGVQGGLDPIPAIQVQGTVGSTPRFLTMGDMVYPDMSRIAVSTEIPLKTIATMPTNVAPFWEDMAVRAITMQEDMLLWQAFELAVTEAQTLDGNSNNVIYSLDGTLSWSMVAQGMTSMRANAQTPKYLVVNPADMQYPYQWSIVTSSVRLKNEMLDTDQERYEVAGLTIIPCITVPQGTAYMVVDKTCLGYMPTYWGLVATQDPTTLNQWLFTTIYSEFVSFLVCNPRGVVKLSLSSNPNNN